MVYKISGKTRRELKKKLSLLKYHVRMFWFYEDIDRVYGGGHEDTWCEKHLKEMEIEIEKMDSLLKQPI